MNFKWIDENGHAHSMNNEIGKIVIYGNGAKLFERETNIETYKIEKNANGEDKLFNLYHDAPICIELSSAPKAARKENLNRKDNYTLTYTPDYLRYERRTALYIHESDIEVTDLGDVLSMETDEEKNYLHAVKLHFNNSTTYQRFHIEHIECDSDWTIPGRGRWSDAYGTEECPCYDTYDYTNHPREFIRAKGKGVIKRWTTTETLPAGAEIITAERYYTKTVESDERKRKNAIAEKLNQSGQYNNSRDRWSHYDITKLEKALGYKLAI